jgi:hypothetical protein
MRRYRLANTPPYKRQYLRKSQLWSEDFTAKLFCNVEFRLERLPELIGIRESGAFVIQNSGLDPFTGLTLSLTFTFMTLSPFHDPFMVKGLTLDACGDMLLGQDGQKPFQFVFTWQMQRQPFEETAISPEPCAVIAIARNRKVLCRTTSASRRAALFVSIWPMQYTNNLSYINC